MRCDQKLSENHLAAMDKRGFRGERVCLKTRNSFSQRLSSLRKRSEALAAAVPLCGTAIGGCRTNDGARKCAAATARSRQRLPRSMNLNWPLRNQRQRRNANSKATEPARRLPTGRQAALQSQRRASRRAGRPLPFDSALPNLRMNRPVGRFTKSKSEPRQLLLQID
jgi:hypothetical protein